jgi:hypothetical protein
MTITGRTHELLKFRAHVASVVVFIAERVEDVHKQRRSVELRQQISQTCFGYCKAANGRLLWDLSVLSINANHLTVDHCAESLLT